MFHHMSADVVHLRGTGSLSLFKVMAAAGWLAMVAGCGQAADASTAEDTSDIVADEALEHRELLCNLSDGRTARLFPDGSEIHFVDPQFGTWVKRDGIAYEETPWSTNITDAQGESVASVSKLGYYSETEGFEGNGACADYFVVKTVPPTSAPIAIDDTLEYACVADDEPVEFVVRPKRGEVDMVRVLDGRFYGLTGISFELTHVDGAPARNELSGRTTDGALVQIVETEHGVTITESQIHGTCEKRERHDGWR